MRLTASALALWIATISLPSSARAEIVGGFDETSKVVTLLTAAGAAAFLATSDVDAIEEVGDVLQVGLPLAALGATYVERDAAGRRAFLKSVGTSTLTVALLKEIVDKERPNEKGLNSFPSGHTAAAFSGSSFINLRYGPRWGAPALVLAAYTSASRIRAQKHFLDDVISGLSISVLANRYFTFPVDSDVELLPLVGDDGAGFMVRWKGAAREWGRRSFDSGEQPTRGLRYEWEFGRAEVGRNDVGRLPGEQLSFLFDEANNPTVTARIELGYSPRERHELVLQLAPFEVRDSGMLGEGRLLAGVAVPEGEELDTQFLLYDYRMRYRVLARPERRVRFHAGAGVSFQDVVVGLAWNGGEARLEEGNFIPFVHVDGEIRFLDDRLRLAFESDAGRSGGDRLFDAAATLRYRIHPRWDLSLGARRVERTIETDLLSNELERDQVVMAIGYSF